MGLPKTSRKKDSIWVVVNRLMKSAHFILVRTGQGVEELLQIYVQEIVRLHETPVSIMSDRDSKFLSRFWVFFARGDGSKIEF